MQTNAAAQPASLEFIRRLIAFPTVSRESNLELIEFARAHLAAAGAVTRAATRAVASQAQHS